MPLFFSQPTKIDSMFLEEQEEYVRGQHKKNTRPSIRNKQYKHAPLSTGVGAVARHPALVRLFQPAIVGNVLAQGQLAVQVVVVAVSALDREVAVLVYKALGLGLESLQGGVGPPLKDRVGANEKDKGVRAYI